MTDNGEGAAESGFSVEGNGAGGWTVYCRRCKRNLGLTTMSGTSRLAADHICHTVVSGSNVT